MLNRPWGAESAAIIANLVGNKGLLAVDVIADIVDRNGRHSPIRGVDYWRWKTTMDSQGILARRPHTVCALSAGGFLRVSPGKSSQASSSL
jgi:hypothetical protein